MRASLLITVMVASLLVAVPSMATGGDRDDPLPRVPAGFTVTPFARLDGVATSIAVGPDTRSTAGAQRVYVTDYLGGRVVAYEVVGGSIGGNPQVVASGFRSPLGVAVAADGTMFVADSEAERPGPFGTRAYGRVWRVRDTDRDGAGDQAAVVVKDLPNGRHNTNGIALGPDGLLYVANGNATDDGIEGGAPEALPWSGGVIRVDPQATDLSAGDLDAASALVATGMRNVYDLAFSPVAPTRLFLPTNGVDDARAGDPAEGTPEDSDDLLYAASIERDADGLDPAEDFGFPSCVYSEDRFGDLEPRQNPHPDVARVFGECPTATVNRPLTSFGLHVSANGLAFQTSETWGTDYRNDLFVAEFGNFFGAPAGRKVVRVELDETGQRVVRQSEFLSGAAPLDVAFLPDGAMLVADFSGTIFLVRRAAPVPELTVTATAFQFAPAKLVIPEGATVRWLNDDALGLAHNVVAQAAAYSDGSSGTGSEMNSKTVAKGQSHRVRFDRPGTWIYTCTIAPVHTATMHGTITVVPSGG